MHAEREKKKQPYLFSLIHREIFRTRLSYTSYYPTLSVVEYVTSSLFTHVGQCHVFFVQSTISSDRNSPSPQVDRLTIKQLYFSARTFMRGAYLICCLAPGPVGVWLDYYVNACASCPLLSPSWPPCR